MHFQIILLFIKIIFIHLGIFLKSKENFEIEIILMLNLAFSQFILKLFSYLILHQYFVMLRDVLFFGTLIFRICYYLSSQ